jgi:hypothetical protein
MSHTETHFGKLRKVNLGEQTIEQWCESKCRENGTNEIESYHDNWVEQFRDDYYKKYFIVKDEIWEAYDHIESDREDVDVMIPQPDGSIMFVMQFYNGGTCLSEMIEEGLERINKQNQ